MKQGLRIFVRPGTFFNQLQWSSQHWILLTTFLGVATVETLFGKHKPLYYEFAASLGHTLGLGFTQALWLILFGKLCGLLFGAYLIISFIWFVGNLLGERNSKRVLFRRLAVVFTVFLLAYTAQHLSITWPLLSFASLCLYLWGLVLGYYAIREQFGLNTVETVVVAAFALLLVTSSLHFSSHLVEQLAQTDEVAVNPK